MLELYEDSLNFETISHMHISFMKMFLFERQSGSLLALIKPTFIYLFIYICKNVGFY